MFIALHQKIPILITLASGKIYVGMARKAPNPMAERRFITVLPLMSGFRHVDLHTVVFNTYYADVIDAVNCKKDEQLTHMTLDDLEVVIPTEQIVSAHLFDLRVYERFQSDQSVPLEDSGGVV